MIGQNNVKIALSVGVHNHYKRIIVMDAMAAERERHDAGILPSPMSIPAPTSSPSTASSPSPASSSSPNGVDVNSISDLNLSQFGRSKSGDNGFFETPDTNNISKPEFGRHVEDCELDKSNIVMIGPTGSELFYFIHLSYMYSIYSNVIICLLS